MRERRRCRRLAPVRESNSRSSSAVETPLLLLPLLFSRRHSQLALWAMFHVLHRLGYTFMTAVHWLPPELLTKPFRQQEPSQTTTETTFSTRGDLLATASSLVSHPTGSIPLRSPLRPSQVLEPVRESSPSRDRFEISRCRRIYRIHHVRPSPIRPSRFLFRNTRGGPITKKRANP
jgi:hypothetical protein